MGLSSSNVIQSVSPSIMLQSVLSIVLQSLTTCFNLSCTQSSVEIVPRDPSCLQIFFSDVVAKSKNKVFKKKVFKSSGGQICM